MKNVTTLSIPRKGGVCEFELKITLWKVRKNVRPHQQCPWKTENNSQWFKTETSANASTLSEVAPLKRRYLSTYVKCEYSLTTLARSSFCFWRMWRSKSRLVTTLPMLACIDKELAIWAGDVEILSWRGLVIAASLRFVITTPGMARKPTLATSITTDW
jgi:hypothetical protein